MGGPNEDGRVISVIFIPGFILVESLVWLSCATIWKWIYSFYFQLTTVDTTEWILLPLPSLWSVWPIKRHFHACSKGGHPKENVTMLWTLSVPLCIYRHLHGGGGYLRRPPKLTWIGQIAYDYWIYWFSTWEKSDTALVLPSEAGLLQWAHPWIGIGISERNFKW